MNTSDLANEIADSFGGPEGGREEHENTNNENGEGNGNEVQEELGGAEERSEGPEEGTSEEGGEGSEVGEETGEQGSAGDGSNPVASPFDGIEDSANVSINGHEISFGELKAMAGQAMNLHSAAQQLGLQRQNLNSLYQKNMQALRDRHAELDGQLQYLTGQNWHDLRQRSTPEEFAALTENLDRVTAARDRAKQDLDSWGADDALTRSVEDAKAQATHEAALACAQALQDPATGIPGYDLKAHTANVEFAQKMGIAPEFLDSLTDAAAWKLINMARRQSDTDKAFTQKVAPKAVAKAAKASLKGPAPKSSSTSDAMRRFSQTGSKQDAIDAIAETF